MLIQYFLTGHNAPCLPSKLLHTRFFRFLLSVKVVPREMKTMVIQNLAGRGDGEQGALWPM